MNMVFKYEKERQAAEMRVRQGQDVAIATSQKHSKVEFKKQVVIY